MVGWQVSPEQEDRGDFNLARLTVTSLSFSEQDVLYFARSFSSLRMFPVRAKCLTEALLSWLPKHEGGEGRYPPSADQQNIVTRAQGLGHRI